MAQQHKALYMYIVHHLLNRLLLLFLILLWFRYQQFKDFQKRILVATNLFGRGMDIERVR